MDNVAGNHEKKNWYDKYYKILLFIPIIILIFSIGYLVYFYSQTGDVMYKDTSLSGGTTITLNVDDSIDSVILKNNLIVDFPDLNVREIRDSVSGRRLALIIESSSQPDELREGLEDYLGFQLNEENSSIEFTGSSLSSGFYKQLITAIIISFILMSIVVTILFRTFVPSMAVIFAAFSNLVVALAVSTMLEIRLSAAGIAAFLMLIGYSVDTDILLTTRVIRKGEGSVNQRIYSAFKTGTFMTGTALIAVLPALFLITGLPESFKQIYIILAIGLFADLINTWFTNAGIIKWYAHSKGMK